MSSIALMSSPGRYKLTRLGAMLFEVTGYCDGPCGLVLSSIDEEDAEARHLDVNISS